MSLISMNKKEKNTVVLELEVGKEDFQNAVTAAFKKNASKIQIPGFRKGKATRSMIEKYYGASVFYEDAVNELYPIEYERAMKDTGIGPVDKANIDVSSVDENGFKFTATVTVKPEVKLGEYKGLKAEKKIVSVTDQEVDAEVDRARQQNSRLIDITDRAAQKDDTAVIDFEGFVDGVAFEGGKGENHNLKLGAGQFIPGFEEQIIGKEIGSEFDVNVMFPEAYHAEDLKGKPALFKVKLHSLKFSELPDADDEFAKDVSEFDTLDAYKDDIRVKLQDTKDKTAQNETEDALIEQVIAGMEVDVPEVMFEQETDAMVQDFDYRMRMQGMDINTYMGITGMDMADFRKTFREQAEKKVKIRLALEEIVKTEALTASEEDINAEIEKLAAQYNSTVEDIKKYIPAEQIGKDLTMNKAIDLVRISAVITETKAEKSEEESEEAIKVAKKTKTAKSADTKAAAPKKTVKKKTEDAPAE